MTARGISVTLLMGLALLAMAPFEAFSVSPQQRQLNEEAWAAMDPAGRDALRRTWSRFRSLTEPRRNALLRRMATYERLERSLARHLGQAPSRSAVEESLENQPERIPAILGRHGVTVSPERPLGQQVQRQTHGRIEAFLDGLVEAGRLQPALRPRWAEAQGAEAAGRALPWTEYVREALQLRAAEELYLAERGAVDLEAPPEPEPEARPPLDVVQQAREHRRVRGYLGWAARFLALTPAEQEQLAALPDDELLDRLQRLKEPRIRQVLEERGVAEATIERVLAAPFREQERLLDRVLAGN